MDSIRSIQARQSYYGGYSTRRYGGYSRWGHWGRWVLLGVLLFVALVVLFLFACISARRRRKFGHKPFMGTGWAAPQNGPVTYNDKPSQPTQQGYNSQNAPATDPQPYYAGGGGGQANEYYNSNATAQAGTYQAPSYPPPAQTRA